MPSQRHLLSVALLLMLVATLAVASRSSAESAEPVKAMPAVEPDAFGQATAAQAVLYGARHDTRQAERWAYITAVVEAERQEAERQAVLAAQRLEAERQASSAAAAAKRAPAATTAPRPAATGDCGGWGDVIAAHFPAEQVAKACRVMLCESGGNPQAENSSSSASGLYQFLSGTWESTTGTPAPASAYSGSTQIAAAAKLWRSSGWSPWVCS